MSEETKNPLIESFLKLHEIRSATAAISTSAPISKTVSTAGSSQMTQPVVQQASAAGNMYKANQNPTTAASNYETSYKKFDTSTPQLGVGTKTSNLRVGSSGENVSFVQKQLGIKSDNNTYDDNTKKAVMDYQKKYGLKVDGIVGDQTISHMRRQQGFDKLKSENPIGAKALDARTTQRISAREPGEPIKPISKSNNLVGQGASKPLNAVSDKPYNLSGQIKLSDLESAGLAGKTLPGNDPNERSMYVQRRLRNLASARSSGSFLTQGDNTEMSNKLIEAFMKLHSTNTPNLFEAAKKAKKLDPVGKEDEDIDNDGDKDKSDSYLHNRRKKIAAAMKEDVTSPSSMGIKAPSYAKPKKEKEEGPSPKSDLPSDVSKSMERERERNKEIGEPGSRQRSMIDSAKEAANRSGGLRTPEAIAKGVGAAFGHPFAKAIDAVAGYKKPESKVIQNTGKSSIALKNEEVEFSEAELEHIAAVLEAVGPTPDEYSPSAFGSTGSRSGSLSDTVSEEEKKAYTGKKRGRKPGVKIGSYKRKGGEEGEATTNVSIPHVFHQIRTSKPSDGHYNLQHDMGKDKKGNPIVKSAKVPVTAATEFHKAYLGAEKPRDKEALTDKFVEKHFSVSKPKATGITLPSMPAKKS